MQHTAFRVLGELRSQGPVACASLVQRNEVLALQRPVRVVRAIDLHFCRQRNCFFASQHPLLCPDHLHLLAFQWSCSTSIFLGSKCPSWTIPAINNSRITPKSMTVCYQAGRSFRKIHVDTGTWPQSIELEAMLAESHAKFYTSQVNLKSWHIPNKYDPLQCWI